MLCTSSAFEENEMIQRFFVPGVALAAFAAFAMTGASPSFALTAKAVSYTHLTLPTIYSV